VESVVRTRSVAHVALNSATLALLLLYSMLVLPENLPPKA
jgi:hypothetical protein